MIGSVIPSAAITARSAARQFDPSDDAVERASVIVTGGVEPLIAWIRSTLLRYATLDSIRACDGAVVELVQGRLPSWET